MNPDELLIAYPGHALVGMKARYGDFEGQIAIPDSARSKTTVGRLGQVCSVNPYPEYQNNLVFERGKLVARPAWKMNKTYTDLLGKFVICQNASLLWGELYSVRLEFIESIAPEDIEATEAAVQRCYQCKSKGEANILLGADGYCPICGMNKYKEHIDAVDLRQMLGEDETLRDNILRIPLEIQHVLNDGGALKGKVFSFPNQKHHGSPRKANLDALSKKRLGGK